MPREIKGVMLKDALEFFADPNDWRDYLTASAAPPPRGGAVLFPGIDATEEEIARHRRKYEARSRYNARISRAFNKLFWAFMERLRSGELLATGYQAGADLTQEKTIKIPADLWHVLKPNLPHSTASGGGYELVIVRVERAAGALIEMPNGTQKQGETGSGFPGRPSIMPAIEVEMRRRAAEGLLERSLARECAVLEEWARHNFSGLQTPKRRSIGNALGATYRELVAQKPSTK